MHDRNREPDAHAFLARAARTAVVDCLDTKPGERFLIITNPGEGVLAVRGAS